MRDAILLVNPSAGRGRAARGARRLASALSDLGWQTDVRESEDAEHLSRLAEDAASEVKLIVSCGGDGTLHYVLQGIDPTRTTLAVAPLGSGNDFATVVGMPRGVEEVARRIDQGVTTEVDVALANGRRYLGVAALGFDSVVARHAQGVRFLRGSSIYLWSTLRVLTSFEPHLLRYSFDGVEREEHLMLAAVGNTDRYGGGVRITPGADPADGALNACIVHECSALELLTMLPGAYRGRHVRSRFVEMLQARELAFDSDETLEVFADGELVAETPVRFGIEERRLTVIRGADPQF